MELKGVDKKKKRPGTLEGGQGTTWLASQYNKLTEEEKAEYKKQAERETLPKVDRPPATPHVSLDFENGTKPEHWQEAAEKAKQKVIDSLLKQNARNVRI